MIQPQTLKSTTSHQLLAQQSDGFMTTPKIKFAIGGLYKNIDYNFNTDKGIFYGKGLLQLNRSHQKVLYTYFNFLHYTSSGMEGNLALGYRKIINSNNLIRTYIMFDYRNTDENLDHFQITEGAEWWYNKIYMGGNAYVPLSTRQKFTYDKLDEYKQKHYRYTNYSEIQDSLYGGDISMGIELWDNRVFTQIGIEYFSNI